MKEILKSLRHEKFIGVSELSAQVAAILENSNTYQEKATITEYPVERTIRYYITEGLLPPSAEKQGTASVFGYEHLLALLIIKKLQAQNLPIKKIREILADKNIGELETLLGIDATTRVVKNEAQRFLESLLLKRMDEPEEVQDLLMLASPIRPRPQGAKPRVTQKWERFEIEKGLELHVEENFIPPSDSNERRTLIKVIEDILSSLRNKLS